MKRFTHLIVFLLGLALLQTPLQAESVNFKLRDIEGNTVELDKLVETGPVLISFWATFCEPCKKEIPHLIELVDKYADQGMQLVLISVDTPRSQGKVRPYAQSRKWEHPVLLDPNGRQMKKLKGSNPPYTMIVTQEDVVYRHSGYRPGDEKELAEVVAGLFPAGEGK